LGELRDERAFWRDYFDHVIDRLTKEDWLGRLRIWMDFDLHDTLGDSLDQRREVLIVEAEGDSLMSPAERALLKACYPQAQVHTLHDSGHLASLARVEEYIAVVSQFLRYPAELGSTALG